MTVIFSALVIICGVRSAILFLGGNISGGLISLSICILSIIALLGRIMSERGLFGAIKTKDDQKNTSSVQSVNSDADEIKKYKELLDQGAITEEEYKAKKLQILGL